MVCSSMLAFCLLSQLLRCVRIEGAVWLYGDFKKQPGLIGFMHSARKELKGDRLRTLVGWGEQPLDYEKALQSVQKLDLVINVIKDGRNGIYGSNETEVSPALTCCSEA